jgi:hypothetical protein
MRDNDLEKVSTSDLRTGIVLSTRRYQAIYRVLCG